MTSNLRWTFYHLISMVFMHSSPVDKGRFSGGRDYFDSNVIYRKSTIKPTGAYIILDAPEGTSERVFKVVKSTTTISIKLRGKEWRRTIEKRRLPLKVSIQSLYFYHKQCSNHFKQPTLLLPYLDNSAFLTKTADIFDNYIFPHQL